MTGRRVAQIGRRTPVPTACYPSGPVRRAAAASLALVAAACGDPEGELREWQPSDHQAPAASPDTVPQAEVDPDPEATEIRAATALFASMCGSCHGLDGRGGGPGVPPGATMPDLASAALHAERSDDELAQVISAGRGLMPGFGDRLSPAGIAALTRHVRRLGAPPGPTEPSAPARGPTEAPPEPPQ
jgi:mono/diheme cytochrome c family protein